MWSDSGSSVREAASRQCSFCSMVWECFWNFSPECVSATLPTNLGVSHYLLIQSFVVSASRSRFCCWQLRTIVCRYPYGKMELGGEGSSNYVPGTVDSASMTLHIISCKVHEVDTAAFIERNPSQRS